MRIWVPFIAKWENLKNSEKKAILNALKEKRLTVPELAKTLDMPADKAMYYLMTLQKYGFVEVDEIDDMDEYFYYKIIIPICRKPEIV